MAECFRRKRCPPGPPSWARPWQRRPRRAPSAAGPAACTARATSCACGRRPELLTATLGRDFGLVRVLFFDKPPGSSWALPWHKDLTVAVRDNSLPSDQFTRPTRKAGVPHAEAPQDLLEQMLTLRVHLDDVTEENGPLKVVPRSHLTGKAMSVGGAAVRTVLARSGDVLLMRPLLAHASGHSRDDTTRHRRILHLEFAGRRELPDGYAWYDFLPAA